MFLVLFLILFFLMNCIVISVSRKNVIVNGRRVLQFIRLSSVFVKGGVIRLVVWLKKQQSFVQLLIFLFMVMLMIIGSELMLIMVQFIFLMKNRFMNFMIMGFVSVIFCGFDVLLMKNVVRIIVIIVRRLRVIVFFFFIFVLRNFVGIVKIMKLRLNILSMKVFVFFIFFVIFVLVVLMGILQRWYLMQFVKNVLRELKVINQKNIVRSIVRRFFLWLVKMFLRFFLSLLKFLCEVFERSFFKFIFLFGMWYFLGLGIKSIISRFVRSIIRVFVQNGQVQFMLQSILLLKYVKRVLRLFMKLIILLVWFFFLLGVILGMNVMIGEWKSVMKKFMKIIVFMKRVRLLCFFVMGMSVNISVVEGVLSRMYGFFFLSFVFVMLLSVFRKGRSRIVKRLFIVIMNLVIVLFMWNVFWRNSGMYVL